jgi:hypothetical protein
VDEDTGLRMELYRTLNAGDGIGNMLKSVAIFSEQQHFPVINVCMENSAALHHILSDAIAPWNRFNNELKSVDFKWHHSVNTEVQSLYPKAIALVNEKIPQSILSTFPCNTKYFRIKGDKTAEDFIQALNSNKGSYGIK